MSCLIANLPSHEVWVRKEYLTDHQSGHGEFVKGVWVSVKSIPGRAFYFETYLPEYAAMYDKLPISAFVADPETPSPDMNLSLTPVEPKMPDFKVLTQYYQVENGFERLGMGREDEYFWKTAQERENSSEEGKK